MEICIGFEWLFYILVVEISILYIQYWSMHRPVAVTLCGVKSHESMLANESVEIVVRTEK